MFFLKRNKLLYEKINEYISIADRGMDTFKAAMECYFKNGRNADFNLLCEKVTMLEHDSDGLLHDVEGFLYKKSLLPESREDILVLFEKYDDVMDEADHALNFIESRQLDIPEALHGEIGEIVTVFIDDVFSG